MSLRLRLAIAGAIAAVAVAGDAWAPVRAAQATAVNSAIFREFTWRNIGPFRGGHTDAGAGIPSQPNVFYIGVADGGVWKTDDAGRTWRPVLDRQPTGAIGAIAVAPSDPAVVYVGTSEGLYKSSNSAATWTRLSLNDTGEIRQVIIDPSNANVVFVAALGHRYGPNTARGIFRSTDGGRSFDRVLFKDEDTGGVDLAFDPAHASTIYAALSQSRESPWNGAVFLGPGTGLFKSTDAGINWRPIGQGLPTFDANRVGRINMAVTPANPQRLFAIVEASTRGGLYRSDDAGETWSLASADPWLTSDRSTLARVSVDPTNADVVYIAGVAAWKSIDAGRTFSVWRGAPGGDGYRAIWLNPTNPTIALMTGDRGAIVTVNGGNTWSSWYNQPTSSFSHVTADNAFPYRICGGDEMSGALCVASLGPDGQVTARDWRSIGSEGDAGIAPDPNDPDIIYSGRVTRSDRRAGEMANVTPPHGSNYRGLAAAPVLFAPTDGRSLFFAANTLWNTLTGGQTWTEVSPDLSRRTWDVPASVGVYRTSVEAEPSQRGAISAVTPSSIDGHVIWAGTDDGQIQVTRNSGATWTNATPAALAPWAKVSRIEASHFDVNSAYAAIDATGLDDLSPHILRTRDLGATWIEITHGLPTPGPINAIREDPFRRGLLFAGSTQSIYVSFDDGEIWQPLGLNLPATSVQDITIKDTDLIIATRGRGLWVLDDFTAMRQITGDIARADAFLFRPTTAWRMRWNQSANAPPPPDEPAAPNPPDGVVISYELGSGAHEPVVLEIVEALSGEVMRRYSSDDPVDTPVADPNVADSWIRPPQRLSTMPGLHRIVWDLRYAPPAVDRFHYSTAAVPGNTPREPRGVLVLPGIYQVRLSVGGQSTRQAIAVRMDPRVRTSTADLELQFKVSKSVDDALQAIAAAREDVNRRAAAATGDERTRLQSETATLGANTSTLAAIFETLQQADVRPLPSTEAAATAAIARATAAIARTQ